MKRYTQQTKSPDGKRYFLNKYYPEVPIQDSDLYIVTSTWERLETLAEDFYGDSSLYWIIAIANPNDINFDSLYITKNSQLRIPIEIDIIKEEFINLNNI